jgi:hypothetical protein
MYASLGDEYFVTTWAKYVERSGNSHCNTRSCCVSVFCRRQRTMSVHIYFSCWTDVNLDNWIHCNIFSLYLSNRFQMMAQSFVDTFHVRVWQRHILKFTCQYYMSFLIVLELRILSCLKNAFLTFVTYSSVYITCICDDWERFLDKLY